MQSLQAVHCSGGQVVTVVCPCGAGYTWAEGGIPGPRDGPEGLESQGLEAALRGKRGEGRRGVPKKNAHYPGQY